VGPSILIERLHAAHNRLCHAILYEYHSRGEPVWITRIGKWLVTDRHWRNRIVPIVQSAEPGGSSNLGASTPVPIRAVRDVLEATVSASFPRVIASARARDSVTGASSLSESS